MSFYNINIRKPLKNPKLYLYKPNREMIASLKTASITNHKITVANISELTFSLPYQIDLNHELVKNPYIDLIRYRYLVQLVEDGYEEWFLIETPNHKLNDETGEEKTIECFSLAYELRNKKITYSTEDIGSQTPTQVLNANLTSTLWTIDYIDPYINSLKRQFDVSNKSVLDFVLNDVAETFNCVPVFNTINRTISLYKKDDLGTGNSLGTDRGLHFNTNKYLTSLDYTENPEEFCTHFKLKGKDGLTINSVNPTMEDFIFDYSHFLYPYEEDEIGNVVKSSYYMSDNLAGKILDYQNLLNTKKGTQVITQTGTTTTNITIPSHGLVNGDYILNKTCNNEYRKVIVVDVDNITVESITGQASGNTIYLYKDETFRKLLFSKSDKQLEKDTISNELTDLETDRILILDIIGRQQENNTYTSYDIIYNNSPITKTIELNSILYYTIMCKVSSITNLTVSLDDVQKILIADTWAVLGKISSSVSTHIDFTGIGTNINVQLVCVAISHDEFIASGNESDLIEKYNIYNKETQITNKNLELEAIETEITNLDTAITNLKNVVSRENNFTQDELIELTPFIIEETWSNDNYDNEIDLYEAGIDEFQLRNEIKTEIKISIENFLQCVECQFDWDKLNLADTVTIRHDNFNLNAKAIITQVEFNYETGDVDLVISNIYKVLTEEEKIGLKLYQSMETTEQLNKNKINWNDVATNFNVRNDRISTLPANPIIAVDGTAIDHTLNTDGSCDIGFRWSFNPQKLDTNINLEYNIDGFIVYIRSLSINEPYIFGSSVAKEQIYNIKLDKRSYVIYGVSVDKYYTFGIQAYRKVDKDINSEGVLYSDIVKSVVSTENPYHPADEPVFLGKIDDEATIGNSQVSTVIQDIENSKNLLNDIVSDSRFTPNEKQLIKKEWDIITSEKSTMDSQAGTYGVSKVDYDNKYIALNDYITPLLADLTVTSDIVADTFRTKFKDYYDAKILLLNAITDKAKQDAIAELNNFVTIVYNEDISNLQSQIDGSITTWFYDYEPTLLNLPASDWTTDTLKNNHLGDLFYNSTTGYGYRFALIDSVYQWKRIEDTDVVKALANAQKAQDTADSKRRVFYNKLPSTPTPPYDKGDLWTITNADDSKGDLKKCIVSKTQGQSYVETDWELATKYTDDTTANEAIQKLADIANDNKLTPSEKQDTLKEWIIIQNEKTTIDSQADIYSITTEKINYDSSYNVLNSYITPLLLDLTTTITIVGDDFRTNFRNYYDKKTTLLAKISEVAKNLADNAQDTADTAEGNAQTALGGTLKYRTTGVPTNNPIPSGIQITENSNGTRNIKLQWNQYIQGELQADMLLVFWCKANQTPVYTDTCVPVNVNTSASSYYIFEGVSPSDTFSFGIASARRTENGLEIGQIQTINTETVKWINITPATPNYTANIGGESASEVASKAINAVQIDDIAPTLTTVTLSAVTINSQTNGDIKISITKPTDIDLTGFNIWRNTTNDSATSILIKSITISYDKCPSILEYIDDTTVCGTDYYYWVTAIDFQGNECDKFIPTPSHLQAVDNVLPSPPTNLSITGGWGRIDLSWDTPTDKDILKYKILISDTVDFASPTTVYSFSSIYTDFGRTNTNTRYYRVYSIDVVGNVSSAYISGSGSAFQPADNNPPIVPSILDSGYVSDNNGRITITFLGSTSVDAKQYRIVRHRCTTSTRVDDDGGKEVGLINHIFAIGGVQQQHKFIDSYLEKNKYYYYQVFCIDNSGMISTALDIPSGGLAVQAIDTTPPNAPVVNFDKSNIGSITIGWEPSKLDGQIDTSVVSYKVYQYDENGTNEVVLGITSELFYTDNTPNTDVISKHRYKITAIDNWDNETDRSGISFYPTTGYLSSSLPWEVNDTTAPEWDAININPIVETLTDGTIQISWSLLGQSFLTDDQTGVAGYNVWRYEQYQNPLYNKLLIGTVASGNIYKYIDTTTKHETIYYYWITAFDKSGNESSFPGDVGISGTWQQITAINSDNPLPPTNISVTANLGAIDLKWDTSLSNDVYGYIIERTKNINDLINNPWTELYEVNTNNYTEYNVSTIKDEIVYWRYRVKAVDIIGLYSDYLESGKPDTSNYSPCDNTPPSPPNKPVATNENRYDGSIKITWTHDNPPNDLEKYIIYRREDNSSDFGEDVSEYGGSYHAEIFNGYGVTGYATSYAIVIAEVDKDTTEYVDTGLGRGKYYKYSVASVDNQGNSGERSLDSDVCQATDGIAPDVSNLNLTATSGFGAIILTWNEVEGECGETYSIYRKKPTDEMYYKIATVVGSTNNSKAQNTYVDYDPPSDTSVTWLYKMVVVDSWGNYSDDSEIVVGISLDNYEANITKSSTTFIVGVEGSSNNVRQANYIVPEGSTSAQIVINQAINDLPIIMIEAGNLGSNNTISIVELGSNANTIDDFYNGYTINIIDTNNNIQSKMVIDYVGSTRRAILSSSLTSTPTNSYTYNITSPSGTITLLEGKYIISDSIKLCSGVIFQGKGNTIITTNTNGVTLIKNKDSINCDITIENIILDGNNKLSNGGMYLYINRGNINNCKIYNINGNGVEFNKSNNLNIINSNISYCAIHGIHTGTSNSINISIINNKIFNNTRGLWIVNCSNIMINNNTIYNNEAQGIMFYSSNNKNTILNNIIYNSGQSAMYLWCNNCIISGNILTNNCIQIPCTDTTYIDCIYLITGNYNNISNNIIRNDSLPIIHSGIAQTGTNSTIQLATTASSDDDYYTGKCIFITSETGFGQFAEITGYVGSTRQASISTTNENHYWTTIPDNTSVYEIRNGARYAIKSGGTENLFSNNDLLNGWNLAYRLEDIDSTNIWSNNRTA
ncbi:MAG: right-handed parallel beta-helix repeat-containing protein [Clostridium sp.]|uniref:DUF7359 domain-containing protein n=1 Tax=Clostridium sp. TaxID=1506 RepID=UPI0025C1F6DA|nr:right-handed parallel beta-helix repeat-containing protein [Clostridium sp.]MCE5220059.1 right-handed parallel beta-helix repeat-containing protein [Clostridium sp.]